MPQPRQPTIEEQITMDFYKDPYEWDQAIAKYNGLNEYWKRNWDQEEIYKINDIHLKYLDDEILDIIYKGTISPVAKKHMIEKFEKSWAKEPAKSSENIPEKSSGGRRRRNKKRSIIRKKKRGKKTRKYRNKY